MARKRWWNWNNKSCRLEALHVMCGLDKFGFIYGSSHENYLDLVSAKQTRNMFLFDSFSVILLPEPACSIVCYSFRKNYPMCSGSPKKFTLWALPVWGRGGVSTRDENLLKIRFRASAASPNILAIYIYRYKQILKVRKFMKYVLKNRVGNVPTGK